MDADKYLEKLGEQIAEAERHLARLRLKLEVATEVAAEMEEVPEATDEGSPTNGVYSGLMASDAILRFLADHGPSPRKTILDALEGQIKTRSSEPRNIVRNCLSQLIERNKVEVDPDGIASLKTEPDQD